ncbi:MAG TPA: glycosyltransferase [Candidatus Dormibacteraeota bacterium]|nr:glycosyltransferase [Candidatus Dormibacteraeota bacterium]
MTGAISPRCSVIIPTFNRCESLMKVLEALRSQSCPDSFEVIVVSDGSTDETVSRLRATPFPFLLRVLEQPNAGPAAARNLGVDNARAALIVFLDDDVVPGEDFIAEHVRAHEGRNDLVVIGPMLPAADPTSPWVYWETEILEKQYRCVETGEWNVTPRQFYTGNASVRREHVLAAGGFDPSFRRSEDVELAYRMQRLGLAFAFHRAAAGTHIAERSYASWLKVANQYGRNDVAIGHRKNRRDLLESVAAEFHQRHALTRLTVRAGLRFGWIRSLTASAMSRAIVNGAFRLRLRRLARLACSATFNLHYWYGVADELGSRAAARSIISSSQWAAPAIVGHALATRGAPRAFESAPELSVVICTRDRPRSLKTAVASVMKALPAGSELIVVDQGEDDAVRAIVAEFDEAAVRYLRCLRRGLSAARNEGASRARNRVIVFTDDDCEVAPDWGAQWQAAFTRDVSPGVAFGEVARAEHDPAQGFVPGFDLVPGMYGRELFKQGIGSVGMGANMALRREVWQAIGGFDESLGSGRRLAAAEDTDFAYRAVRAGYRVLHAEGPKVVHHGFRSNSEASRLVSGYMGGIAAMYMKHARCGDPYAARLFLQEGANLSRNVVVHLVKGKRPLGARSLAAFLSVGFSSLRLPVDTRLRVFASLRVSAAQ